LEYSKLENSLKAIELMESILERDPEYLGAYYTLGRLYEKTGKAKEAILTYQKGMQIAKNQKNQKALGELNEALELLE
jgi:tetratricopeptide (TPR) repeat protein